MQIPCNEGQPGTDRRAGSGGKNDAAETGSERTDPVFDFHASSPKRPVGRTMPRKRPNNPDPALHPGWLVHRAGMSRERPFVAGAPQGRPRDVWTSRGSSPKIPAPRECPRPVRQSSGRSRGIRGIAVPRWPLAPPKRGCKAGSGHVHCYRGNRRSHRPLAGPTQECENPGRCHRICVRRDGWAGSRTASTTPPGRAPS